MKYVWLCFILKTNTSIKQNLKIEIKILEIITDGKFSKAVSRILFDNTPSIVNRLNSLIECNKTHKSTMRSPMSTNDKSNVIKPHPILEIN